MMKKSFWYNSDQNGDLLKPRTGQGQCVVDIDNMLFAISGLSNCTVSTYRVFLQCTMCTLFSVMPLYLLWPCIRYNQKGDTGAYFRGNHELEFQNHENVKKLDQVYCAWLKKGLLCLYILYWVSKGLVCLYILEKVEIWSGDTDASLTDWLTDRQ